MAARLAILALTAVITFGVVAAILVQVLPGPHSSADYLVIGSISTLVALVAVFVALVGGWLKTRDIFYRRRPKLGP